MTDRKSAKGISLLEDLELDEVSTRYYKSEREALIAHISEYIITGPTGSVGLIPPFIFKNERGEKIKGNRRRNIGCWLIDCFNTDPYLKDFHFAYSMHAIGSVEEYHHRIEIRAKTKHKTCTIV